VGPDKDLELQSQGLTREMWMQLQGFVIVKIVKAVICSE